MAVTVVFLIACESKESAKDVQAPPKVLPVTHVMVRDTNLFREYVADIQAVQNVELRARVQGFPFRLVYFIVGDVLWVLAVAHDKRKPGYWLDRLSTLPE